MSVPCPLGLSESAAALPARVSKPSVSTCAPRFLRSDASFEALSRATSNRDLPPCQPCSGSVILADLSTSRTTRAGSSRVPRLMARGSIRNSTRHRSAAMRSAVSSIRTGRSTAGVVRQYAYRPSPASSTARTTAQARTSMDRLVCVERKNIRLYIRARVARTQRYESIYTARACATQNVVTLLMRSQRARRGDDHERASGWRRPGLPVIERSEDHRDGRSQALRVRVATYEALL